MKLAESNQPIPEIIRLFQESEFRAENFVPDLLNSLAKEKAANFTNVNAYLDSSLGHANWILEEMSDFQLQIEQGKTKGLDRELENSYEDLKANSQHCLVQLNRSKLKLTDLKISTCRFIIWYESPSKKAVQAYHAVEEWMDAATLAEISLTRTLSSGSDVNLQKLLALFLTFRSIVCTYDGPAMYIRQIENSIASLDALHEKIRLEREVLMAERTLVQARQELDTAKINLTSLQQEIQEKSRREEQHAKLLSLQEKSAISPVIIIGFCLLMLSIGLGYFLMAQMKPGTGDASDAFSQRSCREIADQLDESPRYRNQTLIFRKFDQDIYFRANSTTCEKLHQLDSLQIGALGELLKADYAAGNHPEAAYNGCRVIQIKDSGKHMLIIKLMNRTTKNIEFKLKVLEGANALRAMLETDKLGGAEDMLIVDLNHPH